jgi:hypothetical protein
MDRHPKSVGNSLNLPFSTYRTRRSLVDPLFLWLSLLPLTAHPSDLAWLKINPNVRSAALGGCGVAVDSDPDAAASNPALLSWLPSPEVGLMHNQWFDDVTLEHFSFGMPLPHDFGAAFLFDYADFGNVQGTRVGSDGYVYPSGLYQPHGVRVGGGLGKHWGPLGFGAAVNGIFENGFGVNQSGVLLGTGFEFQSPQEPLSAGLYAQVSTGKASTGSHKVEVHPAIAAHLWDGLHSYLLGTMEGAFGGENADGSVKFGFEYAYLSKYFARCGYHWYDDSSELGGGRGFTAGLGWKTDSWSLNYALTTLGFLGMGHQFSLQVFFSKTAKKGNHSPALSKVGKFEKHTAPIQTDSTALGDDDTLVPAPVAPENPGSTPTPVPGSSFSSGEGMMVWYQKGMSAYKVKNYSLAIQYLEEAVKKDDPKVKDFYYAEAYATLGALYQRHMQISRPDKARECYLKALQIDPDTESAQKGLKQLDESGQ